MWSLFVGNLIIFWEVPVSTTTLLVAGVQANMGLWSLALVGMVAAGAAITYKLKSKKTEQ